MNHKSFVFLFSFTAIFGSPFLVEAKPLMIDQKVASVNKALILLSEVEHFRKTVPLRRRLDPLFTQRDISKKAPSELTQKEIRDYLIEEQLILNQFPVEDEKVEKEIVSIQSQNNISRSELKTALQNQGFDFKDYFELIRRSLSKRKLIDREIRPKVYISKEEVRNELYQKSNHQNEDFEYKIQMIAVNPTQYASVQKARQEIQKAQDALQKGQSFEKVAKEYSDDPSNQEGGVLGFVQKGSMSKAILEHVKNLEVGETSNIFGQSEAAYFIVRLMDVRTKNPKEFKQQKQMIKKQLRNQEFARQIKIWLERKKQNESSVIERVSLK